MTITDALKKALGTLGPTQLKKTGLYRQVWRTKGSNQLGSLLSSQNLWLLPRGRKLSAKGELVLATVREGVAISLNSQAGYDPESVCRTEFMQDDIFAEDWNFGEIAITRWGQAGEPRG